MHDISSDASARCTVECMTSGEITPATNAFAALPMQAGSDDAMPRRSGAWSSTISVTTGTISAQPNEKMPIGGSAQSGRAGRMPRGRQIRIGFTIMFSIAVVNLVANCLFTAQAWWAIPPIGIFSFGWALMVPVVTLLVLDQAPLRRGMASSLQACIGSAANAFVAGVISPLVMHSTVLLALASLLMSCIGLVAWFFVRTRLALPPPAVSS